MKHDMPARGVSCVSSEHIVPDIGGDCAGDIFLFALFPLLCSRLIFMVGLCAPSFRPVLIGRTGLKGRGAQGNFFGGAL